MKNNEPPRIIAEHRDEEDPCEAMTNGCCIDHTAERDRGDRRERGCDTW